MSDEDLVEQLTQVIFDANAAPWPQPQTIPAERYARAVVAALSSDHRLVPPGSEVREEFGLDLRWPKPCNVQPSISVYDDLSELKDDMDDAVRKGFEVVGVYRRNVHIQSGDWAPWSPSVPDTEEGT